MLGIDSAISVLMKSRTSRLPRRRKTLLAMTIEDFFSKLLMLPQSWHLQGSFTSPDPDNAHFVLVMPVHDTERRVNDLSQMLNIELRYDTTAQGMRPHPFHRSHDLSDKPFPRIRHTFAGVIGLNVLKVLDR